MKELITKSCYVIYINMKSFNLTGEAEASSADQYVNEYSQFDFTNFKIYKLYVRMTVHL